MKIINNLSLKEFEKAITRLFINYKFLENKTVFFAYSSTALKKKWRLEWIDLPILVKELVWVEDHVEAKNGPITVKIWDGDYVFLNKFGDKVGVIYRDSSSTKLTPLIDDTFALKINCNKGNNND